MINLAIIMGRLTFDPELMKTSTGKSALSFSVAVERDYKSGDEKLTDFISCEAYGKNAEFIAKYFTKGQMIAVIGTLNNKSYTDKKTGIDRTLTKIIVNKVSFCGNKTTSEKKNEVAATSYETTNVDDAFYACGDDEFPF